MNNSPLFLFVGKSASGKTTVADMLAKDGYTQISSYTTRAPRYDGEIGHIFVTDEEYDRLENIMASTLYNGHRYCTTLEQVQEADLYVVDVPGVETLMQNYDRLGREVYVLYFSVGVCHRINRMRSRGDSDANIIDRLLYDEKEDWQDRLMDLNENRKLFTLRTVAANDPVEVVYDRVKKYIKNKTK